MADEQKSEDPKRDEKSQSHVLLWSLVTAFIVAAIALMWAVDYFYSPEMLSTSTVPDAVGK